MHNGFKQKKPKNFWHKLSAKQQISLFVCGVVTLIIIAIGSWFVINIQPANRQSIETVEVEVPAGASVQQVASVLSAKKLIKSNIAFMMLSKLSSTHIEAGVHEISASMSASDIINRLSSASKTTFSITIVPEMAVIDMKELFRKYDFTDAEIESALTKQYSHPLLASKPQELDLEGYIFPDTYEVRKQDSLEDLIEMTFNNLYRKLSSDGSLAQINARGMTIHDALTLASIVAKEAPGDEDQKLISGVFWNRLESGISLGSDVTFKYAYKMGYCDTNSPSCNSIWNTRIHAGLPPGPVSNMKYSTIQATLHPTESNYLYFVAGDDGTNHFSTNMEDHQSNINNYCTIQCQ